MTEQTTLAAGEGTLDALVRRVDGPRMTRAQLMEHKDDIQRQAKGLFECRKNVFPDLPDDERWKLCVRSVAEIWEMLGPQRDWTPNVTNQTRSEAE